MIKVLKSRTFESEYKKLHKSEQIEIQAVIKEILKNPFVGEMKAGDLIGLRVCKCKINKNTARLGYTYDSQTHSVYLVTMGHRENFYDKIKRILK